MKKTKKTLLIFALVGVMIMGSAMMAYAQTVSWYFSIDSYNTQISLSSEAVKADWEQTAYITPTSGNVSGYSMNVRFAGGSTSTRYTNFVTISNNYSPVTTSYTTTGVPGAYYYLWCSNGSAYYNGTGRWTP